MCSGVKQEGLGPAPSISTNPGDNSRRAEGLARGPVGCSRKDTGHPSQHSKQVHPARLQPNLYSKLSRLFRINV